MLKYKKQAYITFNIGKGNFLQKTDACYMNSDLFKLVDPEDAPCVPAVGAHFLSEAGGVT